MRAYLILADGTIFEGESIGKTEDIIGEVVFNTSMVGYMETLTDPCYYGQIVTETFPLIGNYGTVETDSENKTPKLSGFIVREICENGSNFRMEGELKDYLAGKNIAVISGIDTRCLTRKLRDGGVMNGMITCSKDNLDTKLKQIKAFKIKDAVKNTSSKEIVKINEGGGKRVVFWDFGAKGNIEKELIDRDCCVIRVPYNTTADNIMKLKPDGIILSNGGGDPAENKEVISELQKIIKQPVPVFGIGLGHQLMAIAFGASTYKLKYGHRGANQPATDLKTNKILITSQNHGYAVTNKGLDANIFEIRYKNVNDETIEGIDYKNGKDFSVQFHPEACVPLDCEYIFNRFIEKMRGKK